MSEKNQYVAAGLSRKTAGYRVFTAFNYIIMLIVVLIILVPVLNVVAKSFSSMKYISMNTITIFPQGFNVDTYKVVLTDLAFWTDYKNTVLYTVAGTLVNLFMTTTFAYALSVPRLRGRKILNGFVIFTMFFSGGIIPNYLLVRNLGLINTLWSVILPPAISVFYLIIMRTFFEGLPRELEEAASIDGLGTYGILARIVLPTSKPILATMTLFYAVGAWNTWFGPFLYLNKPEKFPVTLYLRNMIAGALSANASDASATSFIAANIQSVTIVLTALPILCIYPFLQKYFVQGVMVGSVKG